MHGYGKWTGIRFRASAPETAGKQTPLSGGAWETRRRHQRKYYRYESNVQSPSLETAKKLAVVLGTTLDNLAGLEDGIVIRLPNLSEAEEAALREFIRRFIS